MPLTQFFGQTVASCWWECVDIRLISHVFKKWKEKPTHRHKCHTTDTSIHNMKRILKPPSWADESWRRSQQMLKAISNQWNHSSWIIMNINQMLFAGVESELMRTCRHEVIAGCVYIHLRQCLYITVCVCALKWVCVRISCVWGLLTSSTVTLWLLTSLISRTSGRRREREVPSPQRTVMTSVCVWEDLCVCASKPWERCTHKSSEKEARRLVFHVITGYICSMEHMKTCDGAGLNYSMSENYTNTNILAI